MEIIKKIKKKIMKKIPGNLLKNLEKSWKYHGILSVRKSGNPVSTCFIAYQVTTVQSFYIFQVNVTKVDMVWWYVS